MLLLPFVRCIITPENKNSEVFVKSWINIPNNSTAVSRSGQYSHVSKNYLSLLSPETITSMDASTTTENDNLQCNTGDPP